MSPFKSSKPPKLTSLIDAFYTPIFKSSRLNLHKIITIHKQKQYLYPIIWINIEWDVYSMYLSMLWLGIQVIDVYLYLSLIFSFLISKKVENWHFTLHSSNAGTQLQSHRRTEKSNLLCCGLQQALPAPPHGCRSKPRNAFAVRHPGHVGWAAQHPPHLRHRLNWSYFQAPEQLRNARCNPPTWCGSALQRTTEGHNGGHQCKNYKLGTWAHIHEEAPAWVREKERGIGLNQVRELPVQLGS